MLLRTRCEVPCGRVSLQEVAGRDERKKGGGPRPPRATVLRCESMRRVSLGGFEQSELLQRRHAVVQPDLFDDFAVAEFQHGRSGESHFLTRRGRQ